MFVRHPCIAVVPYAYASDAPSDESFVVTGCDKYAPMTNRIDQSIAFRPFASTTTPRVAVTTSSTSTKDGARVAASSARRRVT